MLATFTPHAVDIVNTREYDESVIGETADTEVDEMAGTTYVISYPIGSGEYFGRAAGDWEAFTGGSFDTLDEAREVVASMHNNPDGEYTNTPIRIRAEGDDLKLWQQHEEIIRGE